MRLEDDGDNGDAALALEASIPIDVLGFDEPKHAFVVYKRHGDDYPTGNFCTGTIDMHSLLF